MIGLLPVEAHDYGLGDALRGLISAFGRSDRTGPLRIDGLGDCLPVRSARAGVVIALHSLGLPPGARIGVPLYCCPVVFKAIRAAGFEPEFLDVDPATCCISPATVAAKIERIEALIAVHMYGHVCDLEALAGTIGNKPVIEDCAQSLGSRLNGRPAGSLGTLSVFSFRLGKYLSVGEGAALYAADEGLAGRLAGEASNLPVPGRAGELRHVAETFLRASLRSRPLWGLLGRRIWGTYNRRTGFMDKSPLALTGIFGTDLAAVRRRLGSLDSLIEAQRANAAFYFEHLELDRSFLFHERPGSFYNRFMFPIIFRTGEERDAMGAFLAEKAVSTSKPYEELLEGGAANYGYAGDCPGAESLLRRVLVIPVHHMLGEKSVERIARSVNEGWKLVRNGG